MRGSFFCPDGCILPGKFVGVDAHIAPLGTIEFALDFRKIGLYRQVDVGIDPYEPYGGFPKSRNARIRKSAKFRRGGRGFRPYKQEERLQSSRSLIYFSLLLMALAACTPEAPACARPLVTPAPSPAAKKPGSLVSRFSSSSRRAE